MKLRSLLSIVFTLIVLSPSAFGVALGNGLKIGEVTATSAIVWTRVTTNADYRTDGVAFKPEDEALPAGLKLTDMRFNLPGTDGEVRLVYYPPAQLDKKIWTPWQPAREDGDYTLQFALHDLAPNQTYEVEAQVRSASLPGPVVGYHGRFKTAPSEVDDAAVSFTVVTCHDFIRRDDLANGHKIYPSMAAQQPDFMVHAGDVEYYDKPGPWAKSAELARYKWNRIFALPFQKEFYAKTPVYFQKDDHDILKNDAWPGDVYGDLTWDEGLAIFKEQTPTGARPYRTVRWGKHLQIWLMEGREFRSPNDMPDGPNKSIWGAEQKAWFFQTFAESDATFRVLISPTPILGPDRPKKNDNHANEGFHHESEEIRNFLATQDDAFVICGDRHWQYASYDANRGIREFGCGPGSDSHAGGWKESERTAEQTFLRIDGGYLRVAVEPTDGTVQALIQHHDVDGNLTNEVKWIAQSEAAKKPTAAAAGWTSLFNGEPNAMERYHLYNQAGDRPERWHVVGKVLTLASRQESPDLRAKEDLVITTRGYTNYELEFDWKASAGANGGIFYKVQEAAKYDKPWHTGLEYQLLDDAAHEEGKIETHRAGDLYDLKGSEHLSARAAMNWNHSRLVVRGSKIEHWLNGNLVVSADTASAEWKALVAQSKYRELQTFAPTGPGQIILQDHGDRLWFKEIRIREL